MPPIPIHLEDPITPEKPQGVTPKTQPANQNNPPPPTTTTDAAPQPQNAYPPPRPGAAAVPAPTPFAQPQPTPTRTPEQGIGSDGPPPPQPGAAPIPPTQSQASNLPPPPKPGEAAKLREEGGPTTTTAMPAQMNIPPPGQNFAPTQSTSTAGAPGQGQGPTTLNLGPVASPPAGQAGYQQNIYAQELSSAQRASLEEQERRESVAGGFQMPSFGNNGGVGSGQDGGGGMLGGGGGGAGGYGHGGGPGGGDGEGMWGAVKGWASGVGNKLVETEEEVWRRINGNK